MLPAQLHTIQQGGDKQEIRWLVFDVTAESDRFSSVTSTNHLHSDIGLDRVDTLEVFESSLRLITFESSGRSHVVGLSWPQCILLSPETSRNVSNSIAKCESWGVLEYQKTRFVASVRTKTVCEDSTQDRPAFCRISVWLSCRVIPKDSLRRGPICALVIFVRAEACSAY
jgi:hypothetical protein